MTLHLYYRHNSRDRDKLIIVCLFTEHLKSFQAFWLILQWTRIIFPHQDPAITTQKLVLGWGGVFFFVNSKWATRHRDEGQRCAEKWKKTTTTPKKVPYIILREKMKKGVRKLPKMKCRSKMSSACQALIHFYSPTLKFQASLTALPKIRPHSRFFLS